MWELNIRTAKSNTSCHKVLVITNFTLLALLTTKANNLETLNNSTAVIKFYGLYWHASQTSIRQCYNSQKTINSVKKSENHSGTWPMT